MYAGNRQVDERNALRAEVSRLRAALTEIKIWHLPSQYPMTDRGLLDYHRALATKALKEPTNG